MESIKIFIKWLLSGIGFSVGALLIYTIYGLFIQPYAAMDSRQKINVEIEQQLRNLSGTIIEFRATEEAIHIKASIKNNGKDAQIRVAPRFVLQDESSKKIDVCKGEPVQIIEAGNEAFFSTVCKDPFDSEYIKTKSISVTPMSYIGIY